MTYFNLIEEGDAELNQIQTMWKEKKKEAVLQGERDGSKASSGQAEPAEVRSFGVGFLGPCRVNAVRSVGKEVERPEHQPQRGTDSQPGLSCGACSCPVPLLPCAGCSLHETDNDLFLCNG